MVHTKCTQCDSTDTREEKIAWHMEIDPTSKIVDEDGLHVKRIETYITICNVCGQGCQIIDLDEPDSGKVFMYKLTKKSENDSGTLKRISN